MTPGDDAQREKPEPRAATGQKPGDHPEFFRLPPPPGRSRESTIVLSKEGRFFHEGAPVEHPGMQRAFASWLTRHPDDGRYILSNGYDWSYLTVEGASRFVHAVRDAAGRPLLELLDGTELPLDPASLPAVLVPSEPPSPDRVYEQSETRDRMRAALAQLPARERRIVSLYYFAEATMKQIGEAIGVNESRVSQLHARAIQRLRRILSAQEPARPKLVPKVRRPRVAKIARRTDEQRQVA